jgi:glycosyltransferase involved in cell wall biosynthesis
VKLVVNATTIASPSLTGIERYALRLSQELYNIDQGVAVFGSRALDCVPTATLPPSLALGSRLLGKREYLLRALWDQAALRWQLRRLKADVVFFPIPDGMLSPPCRQVVTVHDLHYLHFDRSLPECKEEIGRTRTRLFKYKFPRIFHDSSAIVAVSESTKADLERSFGLDPAKIHVIHNGYDDDRFRQVADPTPVLERFGLEPRGYYLYVGSILRHKNLVRLVHALGRLQDRKCLVLVGACKDPEYLEEIRAAACSCGVGDRVRYLDYLDDADLPSLYSAAAAMVLPSLHEGFGVPLIEAMACGVPVITSNCSAMPEVAGKAALFVDPASIESIARAMHEVVEVRQAQELIQLGLARARSFLWSNSARQLYEILCEQGAQ